MSLVKVRQRGQVTLPQDVRDQLQLEEATISRLRLKITPSSSSLRSWWTAALIKNHKPGECAKRELIRFVTSFIPLNGDTYVTINHKAVRKKISH